MGIEGMEAEERRGGKTLYKEGGGGKGRGRPFGGRGKDGTGTNSDRHGLAGACSWWACSRLTVQPRSPRCFGGGQSLPRSASVEPTGSFYFIFGKLSP